MNPSGAGETKGPNVHAGDGDADGAEVNLSEAVQLKLGRSLQAYYDDFSKEPIPDRFLVLLAQLEAQEQKGDKGES